MVNGILRTLASRPTARMVPGRHRTITGIEQLDRSYTWTRAPISRTPRSMADFTWDLESASFAGLEARVWLRSGDASLTSGQTLQVL